MSEWRKPVYADGRLELSFWADARAAMGEVACGVKANPIPALILMVLCLVDSTGLKVPGILIAEEIAVVYISYGVIRKVWAKLNAEDPTFEPAQFKAAEAKMVGVSIIYGMGVLCWALLLIVPAFWWGVRCSLAIVVAALENSEPMACLKRSELLVKGQYWRAFRYAFGGPVLILLGILVISACAYTAVDGLPEGATKVGVSGTIDAILSMSASYWQMMIMPLLVRLYAYLKWDKEVALTDPVNKGFKPSEPRWGNS